MPLTGNLMRYNIIALLILICHSFPVAAQKPLMRHYTIQDGLPSNTIYDIFQDSKGFIWIGTDLGISRFDGHHFENFTSGNGLPDNEILRMKEDPFHRCWLWLYNRKPCYLFNGKVYSSKNDALCRQIEKAGIAYSQMFYNIQGKFCLGGERMCIVYKDSISLYYPQLVFSANPHFYYFQHSGIEYVSDSGRLFKLGNEPNLTSTSPYSLYDYPHYANGHLYGSRQEAITGVRDFSEINLSTNKTNNINLPYLIYDFVKRADDKIWLCSEKGLLIYDPLSGKVDTNNTLLPNISVDKIIKDNEGNYWFATVNDGVYFQAASIPFTYNRESGLSENNVLVVNIDSNNNLIAGYDNGIVDVISYHKVQHLSITKQAYRNRIRYILPASKKMLFVGSDKGLFSIYTQTRISPYVNSPDPQKAAIINGSNCISCSTGGMAKFHLNNKSVGAFWLDVNGAYVNWKKTTTAIAAGNDHKIWIGTLEGIYYALDSVIYPWNKYPALSHARITSLSSTPDAGLIIGTHTNGVYVWRNEQLISITEQNGLSSNICRKTAIDKENNIWVSTNKGLDKITFHSKGSFSIYHFSQSDGLSTNNVNDILFYKDKVYLGASEGIIVIDENHMEKPSPPGIYILSINMQDSVINFPDEVSLDYKQNNILITYTGISFADGKDLIYKYVLLGAGSDTIFTTLTSLNLSTIKSGKYKLLVWAGNKHKQWSNAPAVFTFTVNPPFWKNYWFITICCAIICCLFYLFYRNRINNLNHKQKEKVSQVKKIARLEMQALRSQINPHFIFNALNAIQGYYNDHDELNANYYLSSFSSLIRKTLNNAQTHWLTISEDIEILKTYIELEKMRLDNSFDYSIKVDEDIILNNRLIPAMLLQPYVENAINHGLRNLKGETGRLNISCVLEEGRRILCRVEDNGVGYAKAKQFDTRAKNYKSMGMTITQQRIETINQLYNTNITTKIKDKCAIDNRLHGTIVEISLPLNFEL
jgi:ligand-binding sensor domain-containing protein